MKTTRLTRFAVVLLGLAVVRGAAYGGPNVSTGTVQICPPSTAPCQPVWLIRDTDNPIPALSVFDARTQRFRTARVCDATGCASLSRPRQIPLHIRAITRPLRTPLRPNLTIASVSDTQATLSWNGDTTVRAYNVYRGGTLIQTLPGNVTSFVDGLGPFGSVTAPLTPERSYCYTVAAIGRYRRFMSFASNRVCPRTLPAPPPLTITATYWPAGAATPQTWTVDEHWTCSGFCLPPGPTVHAGDSVQWSVSGGHGPLGFADIADANGFGLLGSQVCSGQGCGGQYNAFCVPGGSNGGHSCYGMLPTGRSAWLDGIRVVDRAGHGVALSIVIRP